MISVDMDGVLCEDPTIITGAEYEQFLIEARPKYTHFEINEIITGRKERFREQTEEWLRRHGIKYKKLLMLPDEKTLKDIARWKAEMYKISESELFIESDPRQAEIIKRLTGKHVQEVK